ncbi:MAG: hypothetical protein H7124_13405 [Phycisphaerales bacterium]|nr:hypothetical protein [Hyphomonadaceae bacterium]
MSETAEDTRIAPGGWLAEHQRAHCNGATALATYQGPLSDEIVLPQSAADAADPEHFAQACIAFCDALLNKALLLHGEFASEVTLSFYAQDYLDLVQQGGHDLYWAQRGDDALALRACAAALKSMLADPQRQLFMLMQRVHKASPREAKRIAADAGYRDAAAALRALDARFAEWERKEPLAPRHKAWLRSFRKLRFVPDAELAQHINRLASSNPLYQRRRAEAEQIRTLREQGDPLFQAAQTLCTMAGLKLVSVGRGATGPMRKTWPEGPDRKAFAVRIETDRGPRTALFYVEGGLFKRRLAVLIEPGESLPLGSLSLTRAEFASVCAPRL